MEDERKFWSELTHLIFVAVALSFFIVSFILLGKIALSKVPLPGLQEAFASA